MIRLLGKVLFIPVFAALLPLPAAAFENLSTTLTQDQQTCYSLAMVGMDSVINSRLGVLPEHVLDLASQPQSLNVNAEPCRQAPFDRLQGFDIIPVNAMQLGMKRLKAGGIDT